MRHPFIDALLGSPLPLIAEVKRIGSDRQDLFRGRSGKEIAALYRSMQVPCMSVVTGKWFGGDSELLMEVLGVAQDAGIPVLQKDLIVQRSQVRHAKELGVRSILLTAELLPARMLGTMIELALAEGITPFVEVVRAEQLPAVVCAEDCVIAVNNKDIRSGERGEPDLARSLRMLDRVLATGTPCPVSASGIDTPETARILLAAGFRGLLVGSALLRHADPAHWAAVCGAGVER